ncbi:MAG: hypothetical protein AABZ64_05040, partial [Nitrospinota bacterium]
MGTAAVLFLLAASLKLQAPLTYWDARLLEWGLAAGPAPAPAGTSPFFLLLLKGLAALGWLEAALLRWVQALGVLLSGATAYLLALRLWEDRRAGALAFALYVLHPAAIQGAHSLDLADASFYPAFVSLWLLEFLSPSAGRGRFVRLGGWSALAMGWKTTSSLGLLLFALPLVRRGVSRKGGDWGD